MSIASFVCADCEKSFDASFDDYHRWAMSNSLYIPDSGIECTHCGSNIWKPDGFTEERVKGIYPKYSKVLDTLHTLVKYIEVSSEELALERTVERIKTFFNYIKKNIHIFKLFGSFPLDSVHHKLIEWSDVPEKECKECKFAKAEFDLALEFSDYFLSV